MLRSASAIAVTLLAGLAITGCSRQPDAQSSPSGSSSVDAAFLLSQAKSNAKAASAVHMRGAGQCDLGPFVVEMDLLKDGRGAGSVKIGGETISVVSTPRDLYMHGERSLWLSQVSPQAADLIGDKWVRVAKTANPCLSALSSFSLALTNYLDYPGTPTMREGDQIQGVSGRLIGLGADASIWVSRTGTIMPLNVHDATSGTDIGWSAWNVPVTVVVPRSDDVLDGAKLAGA